MISLGTVGVSLGLSAVLAAGAGPGSESWARRVERRGVDASLVVDPIAITPEVRAAADRFSGGGGDQVDQLRRLQAALFDASSFHFDYDPALTATAADALELRRGNCVAFTNLFIAMARARGIRVLAGYMTPHVPGEKRGDLVYVSTHVVAVYQLHDRFLVFDFYGARVDDVPRIRLLDDLELAALYVNNRAVEALSRGDFTAAEAGLNAVVHLAPEFAGAYANLGVLKRRRGDTAGALDAYRSALAIDPHNPAVLSNLATLYLETGHVREAQAALRVADMSAATVYTMLARGDLEYADGKADEALRFYRRAARLDPAIPDPHLAIARLERGRGNLKDARRAASKALALAPDNGEAQEMTRELNEAAQP
ncbi:MAG TPA: tetratricopeptide repeat protein [Candidatus Polarisedimenticolaceae bacterium]|nr:tetratricopeptide repeat protein [Candidatus Polarisedimenticolaceae bacterium]